jgi:hypothetical protein
MSFKVVEPICRTVAIVSTEEKEVQMTFLIDLKGPNDSTIFHLPHRKLDF